MAGAAGGGVSLRLLRLLPQGSPTAVCTSVQCVWFWLQASDDATGASASPAFVRADGGASAALSGNAAAFKT